MRHGALVLIVGVAAASVTGCVTESFNRCTDGTATREECESACRAEESPPDWCAEYLTDGGTTDGDTPDAGDGGADAGPCGGCEDGMVCDTSGETPACVQCIGDGDCGGATPMCDTEANTCVACIEDADCTDPAASRCDASGDSPECVPCEGNPDCDGLAGLGVCDTSAEPATCVECTGADYESCDGVCDSRMRTCTSMAEGSADACEPCVTDAQCQEGQLCIEMTFAGSDVGAFCLWKQSYDGAGGPAGSCLANARPYANPRSATSVDGETAEVCEPRQTTCTGLNEFQDECTAADDLSCGVDGLEDAECIDIGAAAFRCNVPCDSKDDCPAPAGGSDRECDMEFTHDPPVCDFSTT